MYQQRNRTRPRTHVDTVAPPRRRRVGSGVSAGQWVIVAPLAIAAALSRPGGAQAQETAASDRATEQVAAAVQRALESRMTVWRTPSGQAVHVSHCRDADEGCHARIALFARWIAEVARAKAIDPFVLAAMAVRESGLDPFVQGLAGEMGIVQLHPRGVGHRVRFVRNEAYRRRCAAAPGACQREVLEMGAQHLADAIARCESLEAALGAYNTGRCGPTGYTRRILRERANLLTLAKRGAAAGSQPLATETPRAAARPPETETEATPPG